jgi:hypothetical protein
MTGVRGNLVGAVRRSIRVEFGLMGNVYSILSGLCK